ncbi:MAG: 3-isopropylmalate dehydratase [Deltaproteobacteria bacterium]|nr:3-isopropylmalate dehydratase [Deltaproteobacteria bacterium]
MPQKVLAGRASDPQLKGELVEAKVDQVILSRAPWRALSEALALGLKKAVPELSIAYDDATVTARRSAARAAGGSAAPEASGERSLSAVLPSFGILVARPGIGFPGPVHIERFAAPARLALTDDPRLGTVGGVGMLCLVVSPAQLGMALATGTIWLRPPRSIQIHLSGRTRPFVCARDVALELLRRDLGEVVRGVEEQFQAPVVLEFAGPSARLLSVGTRAVLCGIAPQVGAAAALFISDDKAEVFLRDQRRSKAHRALMPDPGAPCEEVLTIDLATVDPLIMDEAGRVRSVRELGGRPVGQVVLGGDSGVTLRDMLAAAALLKSKRIPPQLDLLLAPPSRQVLEVLGQSGALVDLVATGARIVEPDRRLMTGELYPPPPGEAVSLRTSDPEPRLDSVRPYLVASAEALSYAVAHGVVGDPRAFKRPARVTVPRVLPTEDVLVVRARPRKKGGAEPLPPMPARAAAPPWAPGIVLGLSHGLPADGAALGSSDAAAKDRGLAAVASSMDEVRLLADRITRGAPVRALIARFLPSQIASALAAEGVACFEASASALGTLRGQDRLSLPKPGAWGAETPAFAGKSKVTLRWLAVGREKAWMQSGGGARSAG